MSFNRLRQFLLMLFVCDDSLIPAGLIPVEELGSSPQYCLFPGNLHFNSVLCSWPPQVVRDSGDKSLLWLLLLETALPPLAALG